MDRIHRAEYQRAESYREREKDRKKEIWRSAEGTLKSLLNTDPCMYVRKILWQWEDVDRTIPGALTEPRIVHLPAIQSEKTS